MGKKSKVKGQRKKNFLSLAESPGKIGLILLFENATEQASWKTFHSIQRISL